MEKGAETGDRTLKIMKRNPHLSTVTININGSTFHTKDIPS
jgi:hypothetical protein